jgi:hypothetical protein
MRVPATLASVVLLAAVATASLGCSSCRTALLVGTLVEQDGQLGATNDGVHVQRIKWPDWYSVERRDGVLVVADFLGNVKARAGDSVRLGGGENGNGVFVGCGTFEVAAAAPS